MILLLLKLSVGRKYLEWYLVHYKSYMQQQTLEVSIHFNSLREWIITLLDICLLWYNVFILSGHSFLTRWLLHIMIVTVGEKSHQNYFTVHTMMYKGM